MAHEIGELIALLKNLRGVLVELRDGTDYFSPEALNEMIADIDKAVE